MGAGTVIIGTGQAGFQTAASLRTEGYQEPITLIGDEPHLPYYRPPLSKTFILGKQDRESLDLRPNSFYTDHNIELLAGQTATAIDTAARTVELAGKKRIPYKKLVLAMGARNRPLYLDGSELDGVLYLRTLDEAIAVQDRLKHANEIVVIGGGFIGLELAAVATSYGKNVTVLEALPRLMSRVVAPIISEYFLQLHENHAVKIACGTTVSEIVGVNGKVKGVRVADGQTYPADLVLVGIGILPNLELARDAGIPIGNGIAVNERLEAVPNIYAIGDCAEFPSIFAKARIRLESVQNAADQAQCVAAAIVGKDKCYEALPWFWTDQFDTKLQMAGLSIGHDQTVTRGSVESGKLTVFYFRQTQLIAMDSINRPLDHVIGRKLLAAKTPLTPEQAQDESIELKKLAPAHIAH